MVLNCRTLPLALALVLLRPVPIAADDLEGVVRMSRAEYDKLKDAAERAEEEPRKAPAPAPPSVENVSYEARVAADRIALELTADVVVKAPGGEARVALPPAGLLDALTDKGPAPVGLVSDAGRATLVFPRPGRYRLGLRFLPAESRSEGQRSVDFTVLPASSARLSGFGSDTLAVSVSGGPQEPLAAGSARSLPASALVRVLVKAPARIASSAEKPLVLCDTVDVLRVERDRVRQRVFVRVSVTRQPLAELVLVIGKGAEVASLSGASDPAFTVRDDGRVVISPSAPVSGDAAFSLLLTRPAPGGDGRVSLEATRVEGAASSRSYVLVEANPLRSQETLGDGTESLSRVDVDDLPAVVLPFASAGTRAYRVAGPGARLALAAPPRAVIAPPDTLLVDADLLTVFGDGGARLDRRRFTFETRLPHLDVPIPEGEEILAVAVDGVPATPRVDGGALVVSLPPSGAPRRIVEVTSKSVASVPSRKGELSVSQRALPGVASLARWTVVLPEDRQYRVERTEGIARVAWTRDAPVAVSHADAKRQVWGAPAAAPAPQLFAADIPPPGTGQASVGRGTLGVRVTDGEGNDLPGANVELKGSGITGSVFAVTDAHGRTSFPALPAGTYTVRGSLAGFSTVERSASVAPGSNLVLPVALRIASISETVVVTAETPVIDTSRSSVGETIRTDPSRSQGRGPDLSGLYRKKRPRADAAEPEEYGAGGGVEGGVEGGVMGGVMGGMKGDASVDAGKDVLSEKLQAGTRSLAMEVTGHGKRLFLSGPLVGGRPVSVTLSVKPD